MATVFTGKTHVQRRIIKTTKKQQVGDRDYSRTMMNS